MISIPEEVRSQISENRRLSETTASQREQGRGEKQRRFNTRHPIEQMATKDLRSAEKTSRVTYVEAGFSDIFGYDGTGSDDRAIAYRDWENGSVCPDTHTITNCGGSPEFALFGRTARVKWIINKHRPMRNETIIPDRDELTDE
jgi:hypothetical protein